MAASCFWARQRPKRRAIRIRPNKSEVALLKIFAIAALTAGLGLAQPAPQAAPQPNDYSDAKTWLCRPGLQGDACDVDLTTTVIAADGKMTHEAWTADPNAPVD